MRSSRRLAAALALAVAAWAGSGCAVIPVGGPFPVDEAGGGDPMSKPFQRMIAVSPQPAWAPLQVVQGLQAAMAAYADEPDVLSTYLTPAAAKTWKPDGPITVIANRPKYDYVGKSDGDQVVIRLTGTPVARIEADDTYMPYSAAVGDISVDFTLVKDAQGGYHVQSVERGVGLLLTMDDVARAYRPTKLYFLAGPPGPSRLFAERRLVVDRVWLRVKPTENFAQTIVRRLLEGPSKALHGAVGSVFPQGMSIRSVRSDDDRVVVDLHGPIAPDDLYTDGLKAQLKWTLNNNDMANGRTIEVQLDGEPFYSSDPLVIRADDMREDWLGSNVSPAYYVSRGAVHSLGDDRPGNAVQGPAGQPNELYSRLSMSDGGAMVAARGTPAAGGGIWVTRVAPDGRWQRWIQGRQEDLTPPSWHRDGTLWTYDRANDTVLRCDPASGRGPERVAAPGLDGLDVTRLRVSRDGVRVAVTVGKNEVRVGAITGGGGAPMLGNFQTLITVTDEEIRDIAWRDGERLLVLIQSKNAQSVREIYVGDGQSTELPATNKRLESISALGQRLLAATEGRKGILEFNQDKQGWVSKVDEGDAANPIFSLG
ncbi:GerMN domain-containing protein [Nonomuraea sp. SMC257]|uniref:GerMN domain-containing protein n=1 Tax=Nonomuraea montanisoli TaxID=2741721 RepID=A0A7Y6I262_9ACTN|nr:LpqB family beta-propeller domain-containing protein [Nonomuraea montanisoli]NUW30096.1 GerMN domain-containing protein [Nonomuraea montanisoli]